MWLALDQSRRWGLMRFAAEAERLFVARLWSRPDQESMTRCDRLSRQCDAASRERWQERFPRENQSHLEGNSRFNSRETLTVIPTINRSALLNLRQIKFYVSTKRSANTKWFTVKMQIELCLLFWMYPASTETATAAQLTTYYFIIISIIMIVYFAVTYYHYHFFSCTYSLSTVKTKYIFRDFYRSF